MSSPWLVSWPVVGTAGARRPVLLCLPSAGAGCGQFRAWQVAAGSTLEVVGVQLPGREERWADPPVPTVRQAVAAVVDGLAELVSGERRLVVFGHSFGGLLGYEITRHLAERTGRWPDALVVAACRPPHMWLGAGRGLVDDVAELDRLLAARGLGPDDLDEDSREELLEVMRQDARLSLSYALDGPERVACPLEAWGGEGDETVTPGQLAGWRQYAAGQFTSRHFGGGHYFHFEHLDAILRTLSDRACATAG